MKPLLEVNNLTKTFRERESDIFTAVDQISFRLYPHETLGIVGESGSGKSTVARAVARLIPVSFGEIFLEGEDITRAKGRHLRRVYQKMQMVFQSPADSFDPRRTLGYSIGRACETAGCPKKKRGSKSEDCCISADFPGPRQTGIPTRSAAVSARERPSPVPWPAGQSF